VVGIPAAIIPLLQEHLAIFVAPAPGALLFTGVKGGPLRRSNFRVYQKQTPKNPAGLDLYDGAGEGNRTPTISLGS
jgi:hypothetical protein